MNDQTDTLGYQEVEYCASKTELFEELRAILENEQHRDVTLAEAQEVGRSLIDFFKVLSDGVLLIPNQAST